MKLKNNWLLLGCVLLLAALCFASVGVPIRFERERAVRERAVKARLLKIRAAEERYRQLHGAYAGSFRTLTRSGLLADSLQYVPYGHGQVFDLQATAVVGKSGRRVPLMECGATYGQYLYGLDKAAVADLTEAAEEAARYPGLKVGGLEEPNGNAGNWE